MEATSSILVPYVLRERCGGAATVSVEGATLRAAFDDLERREPELHRCIRDETGAVRRHLNVFVNAVHVRDLNGLDTALSPGDKIQVIPAVSGG